jgi:hypothetical protein
MLGIVACTVLGVLLIFVGVAVLIRARHLTRVKGPGRHKRVPSDKGDELLEVTVDKEAGVETASWSCGRKDSAAADTQAHGITLQESWELARSADFPGAQVLA